MIEVTPSAIEIIQQFLFERKAEPSIRVDLITIGSSWQSLALRLDKVKKDDTIVQHGDINFLVESPILEYCGSITIDYICHSPETDSFENCGFAISTKNPLP